MERAEREKAIAILQKERKTALHDNVWAFDYAISSLKTDLKYDLMYEGKEIYTKDDMVDTLEDLKKEIENKSRIPNNSASAYDWNNGVYACYEVIQQKIDKLKGK